MFNQLFPWRVLLKLHARSLRGDVYVVRCGWVRSSRLLTPQGAFLLESNNYACNICVAILSHGHQMFSFKHFWFFCCKYMTPGGYLFYIPPSTWSSLWHRNKKTFSVTLFTMSNDWQADHHRFAYISLWDNTTKPVCVFSSRLVDLPSLSPSAAPWSFWTLPVIPGMSLPAQEWSRLNVALFWNSQVWHRGTLFATCSHD